MSHLSEPFLQFSVYLVDLEHVRDVGQDVHVVAEETDVVDAVIADGVAHADSRPRSRLEEGGESGRKGDFQLPGLTITGLIRRFVFRQHIRQDRHFNCSFPSR